MEQVLKTKERSQLRILVVDDMVTMRRTIRNMLRQLGYVHIFEAEDGLSAWNRLTIDDIDVAIVDWNMPHMNGITLLKKTRQDERLSLIPFIMVTAEVAEETIAEAAETEVDAYIIKPFIAKTLEEKIDQVLERKRHPSPLEIHLRLAAVYANAGQFNKATGELKTALTIQPNNPRVFAAFGDLYRQRGMLDDAEKAYKKALLIEPKFMKAHDSLIDVLMKKGEKKKVIAALKEAVSVSPKNASRQVFLGKMLLESGETNEARKAFRYAVKAEPHNSAAQMEIGEILLAKDLAEEAVEIFSGVSKANPNEVHVYNRLGIAYRKQGKYAEAVAEYKKALEIDPADDHLYYNLGRAYMEWGRRGEALTQFRRALELNPDFAEVRELLPEMEREKVLP